MTHTNHIDQNNRANRMFESAKESHFQLPVFIIPVVAFGVYLMGDTLGGSLGIKACSALNLAGNAASSVLLLSTSVTAALVMLWIKVVERRKIRELGLYRYSMGRDAVIGSIYGFATFALILGIGYLLNIITYQGSDWSAANVLGILAMIPFWVIQAGTEEILTRGWLLPEVAAKSNKLIGILVSSAVFVAFHINNTGFNALAAINIFLVGVLLALFTIKRGSLWEAIMFHAFWNFTQGSFFGLSVSGGSASNPSLMNCTSQGSLLLGGGSFGIEASIITTVVLAAGVLVLLATLRRARH